MIVYLDLYCVEASFKSSDYFVILIMLGPIVSVNENITGVFQLHSFNNICWLVQSIQKYHH